MVLREQHFLIVCQEGGDFLEFFSSEEGGCLFAVCTKVPSRASCGPVRMTLKDACMYIEPHLP